MIKNRVYNKLSTKLVILLVFSAIIAFASFGFVRYYSLDAYKFATKINITNFNVKKKLDSLEQEAKNVYLYPKTKKQKEKLKKFMTNHDAYTGIAIYNKKTGDYIRGDFAKVYQTLGEYSPINILKYDFDRDALDRSLSNSNNMRTMKFKDSTAIVYVEDYHNLKVSSYLFYFSVLFAALIFITPSIIFIRRKVKELNQLTDKILIMGQGDLDTPLTVKDTGEIGILAQEVDNLRKTLNENIINENEIRKANKELITSLSHDIRTPMTSLMGYLDILRLGKYQNKEQFDKYLNLCIDKVNQINDLSNKTFEYAVVFQDNEIELKTLAISEINSYLKDSIEYLTLENYRVTFNFKNENHTLTGNLLMLKRVINNLFSNLYKYADPEQEIIINSAVDAQQSLYKLSIVNKKNKHLERIESNNIGLKSVEKIISAHKGYLFINNLKDSFEIIIEIPIEQNN